MINPSSLLKNFLSLAVAGLLSSCANPHFFPRVQPLFGGLDEAHMTSSGRNSLAKAKTDFMLAKHGKTPQYAQSSHTQPHSRTQVYQGDGYRLTVVKEDNPYRLRSGPEIVVASTVTGGKDYRYDEVDEVVD